MQNLYFAENKKEVFPTAAVIVNDRYLYFTVWYNNLLFRLDLETGIQEETIIPFEKELIWPYRKLLLYKDSILLIPQNGARLYSYNIETKKFTTVIDYQTDEKKEMGFRDAVLIGSKIYLLSITRKDVYCVDLETFHAHFLGLGKYLKGNIPISLKKYGENILVFIKGEPVCLLIKLKSGNVNRIRLKHNICYAEVVNDSLIYTSSIQDLDGIYRFDLKSFQEEKLKDIEYKKLKQIESYRYWNNVQIGEKIFFLPHETDCIVTYDLKSNEVDFIMPLQEGYLLQKMQERKPIIDVLQWADDYILIPYLGNKITVIDSKGYLLKTYELQIHSKEIKTRLIEQGAVEGIASIGDFIEYVKGL